ncbi:hypothetical protein L228DRAFT_257498 [Xylona heveae TC161]|uniref:Mitochondrial integral membrane protein n=1 Tax=Xylona heveae (strain CBS 132557 / TC161) TaxID=1328760 RepID=A0A165JAW8_XYLHT|nr:hypothetical protein L228DRAFT_257498 [Xylona heveae TC161]KZF25989.1 hypothetical protein L228DRAFT_257498 [Xylona heveae TC161]
MVSLWKSKNRDEEAHSGSSSPQEGEADVENGHRRTTREEPDERTRLLPSNPNPPPHHDGYLDPDDPAVSPYNLWTVRALRYLSVIFLVVSFLWWVLLLVSIFVSPPGMHSRGSGFFDFSYTTLTVGNLLMGLLFFANPSRALRIGCMILAIILLIDMIIILAVGRIRVEEGWVGIASVVWATVIAAWTVVTDRAVAWGKREEEERLTGRAENRRTLREWCAVFTSAVINVILIIVAILLTATLILRSRDASLAPAGDRYYVDSDKYQIHLACVGNQTYTDDGEPNPTVLVEAGEGTVEYDLLPFISNAYKNGTIDRYCFYDRPGFGWSDNAPSPHSAGMTADVLSEVLAQAGEEGPWVLVSAGIGSVYSRIFSSRHYQQVTGILLIDPLHEDLLYRVGAPGRGFVLWARGIISPLGFTRLAGALFKGRTREDRVYGGSAYQGGKFIKAKLQESLVANSLTKSEVSSARTIQGRDTPLVVVSSGIEVRRNAEWEKKQHDLTTLTDKLVAWDIVSKAPHAVWKTLSGRETLEKRLRELVK